MVGTLNPVIVVKVGLAILAVETEAETVVALERGVRMVVGESCMVVGGRGVGRRMMVERGVDRRMVIMVIVEASG